MGSVLEVFGGWTIINMQRMADHRNGPTIHQERGELLLQGFAQVCTLILGNSAVLAASVHVFHSLTPFSSTTVARCAWPTKII